MEKKAKRSRLAGIPAWIMSIVTLFVLFMIVSLLEDPEGDSLSAFLTIGYIGCVVFITLACFIICMIHPTNIWFTLLICNVTGIMAIIMFVFTDLSTLSEFIFWGGSIVSSVIGGLVGAAIGRRKLN